jgi:hypothetical protein
MVFALSCPIGPAFATQLSGSLVTKGLQGLQGFLFFDFIGAVPVPPGPDNTVQLDFPFGGDGIVNGSSFTGNVAGTGPWIFSLGPTFFPFNEVQVDYTFGTLLTFSFTTSDVPPPLDSPQAFSLSVEYVDPDTGALVPLITSDLCGNALFSYTIGLGADALQVCQPTEVTDVSITVAQAPEPSSLALFAIGVVALAWRQMTRLASTRLRRIPISLRS